MKRKFPRFASDKQAEEFVARADLSEYDFSEFRPMRFEINSKSKKAMSKRSSKEPPKNT